MYTILTRKPRDLDEVMQNMQYLDHKEWVEITEEVQLTPEQYESFWNNPLGDEIHEFLSGKGGYQNHQRVAVLLRCDHQKPIVVDPSGSAYGQYVGFEVK